MATRPLLQESSARTLVAGDLQAVFLPEHGMLGASLRYQGEVIPLSFGFLLSQASLAF
jgi:hypothetical protein